MLLRTEKAVLLYLNQGGQRLKHWVPSYRIWALTGEWHKPPKESTLDWTAECADYYRRRASELESV